MQNGRPSVRPFCFSSATGTRSYARSRRVILEIPVPGNQTHASVLYPAETEVYSDEAPILCDQGRDQIACNVCQPEIAALKFIGQTLVVDAQAL